MPLVNRAVKCIESAIQVPFADHWALVGGAIREAVQNAAAHFAEGSIGLYYYPFIIKPQL
jgi:hypothetical protein